MNLPPVLKCQKCNGTLQSGIYPCTRCGQLTSIRQTVFEVIVLQALAGAPWWELCQGPMQLNHITTGEVEEELRRRRGGDEGTQSALVPKKPRPSAGSSTISLSESDAEKK